MAKTNQQIAAEIADKIIANMETHGTDWRKPWIDRAHNAGFPVNVASNHDYKGVNVYLLLTAGFGSSVWGTYKQWQEKGAQVLKGEKATKIVFWKPMVSRDTTESSAEATSHKWLLMREYAVFNADQVEGWNPKPVKPLPELERNAAVDAWIGHTGAVIRDGGNRAFYSPSTDHIQMPDANQFQTPDGYYATKLHELTHWTGSEKRCNRQFGNRFGTNAYAFEELVAELGSAFLCLKLDVTDEPRPDHAKYLNGWIAQLKSDKQAILTAFSKAQQAATFLDGLQPGAKIEEEEAIAA